MNKRTVLNLFFMLLLLSISCVGPPEADRGLTENIPEVYSSENDFSFTLLGNKFSKKEIFPIEFAQDSTVLSYTVLLLVSEAKSLQGNPSGITLVFNSNDFQNTLFPFNGNTELVYNKMTENKDGIPDSLFMDIRSFTGLLEFNLIAHRDEERQLPDN